MPQEKPAQASHSSVRVEEKEYADNLGSSENGRIIAQIREAPLPDPQELREYKSIDKSLPGKIIKMAEKEQRFRHFATYLGQFHFIALVIGGYGLAAFAGINGAQWTGAAIAGGVSYVAYVFKTHKPKPPSLKHSRIEEDEAT